MFKFSVPALFFLLLSACSLLSPFPDKVDTITRAKLPEQLGGFNAETTIYWDKNLIPFIHAENDLDLARALGIVHAHLRLGQMEMFRRVAHGRLSEAAGLLTVEIDQALRILGLDRAAEKSADHLSPESRLFIEAYVSGINSYQDNLTELPYEFRFAGLKPEKWTVTDILAITRLAGADVNWLVWSGLIDNLNDPAWSKFWSVLSQNGADSLNSFSTSTAALHNMSRLGSNAFAVSGKATRSGASILAADPHVGFNLPNLWLLCGVDSPSYKASGMMMPGLPVILLGRNQNIAWGATNMRALSSRIFKIESTDKSAFSRQTESIKVRWWWNSEVIIREGLFGNLISDIERLKAGSQTLSLKWTGQEPSDEISSLLNVMKADNWQEFQSAFKDYAVSGQNYLYADNSGNIGQLAAARLPLSNSDFSESFLQDKSADWSATVNTPDLPKSYNPDQHFLASANNRPVPEKNAENPLIGHIFSGNDRIRRITELVEKATDGNKFEVSSASSVQMDVFSESHFRLKNLLVDRWNSNKAEYSAKQLRLLAEIERWDGEYQSSSRSALLFNIAACFILKNVFYSEFGEDLGDHILKSDSAADIAIKTLDHPAWQTMDNLLSDSLNHLATKINPGSTWGDFHKLRLQHILGNIPVLGKRFRFGDIAVSGSSGTILKTYSGFSDEEHFARYGANSRFIFDLAEADYYNAVLLGGQDGWISAANFNDQTEKWKQGMYLKVPATIRRAREQAISVSELGPQDLHVAGH